MTGDHSSGGAAALALDPAAGLLAAIAIALSLTVLALLRRPSGPAPRQRTTSAADPLEAVFERRRHARSGRGGGLNRAGSGHRTAVLEARIDRLDPPGPFRKRQARKETTDAVARVMRAGLRRTDELRTIPGDGFVILVGDAREEEAAGIARRLHRALAGARIPGLGAAMRVSARFGVAEARAGEGVDAARARASGAVDAASRYDEDCVVMASEIEELLFLPPPDRARDGAVSKAA